MCFNVLVMFQHSNESVEHTWFILINEVFLHTEEDLLHRRACFVLVLHVVLGEEVPHRRTHVADDELGGGGERTRGGDEVAMR